MAEKTMLANRTMRCHRRLLGRALKKRKIIQLADEPYLALGSLRFELESIRYIRKENARIIYT